MSRVGKTVSKMPRAMAVLMLVVGLSAAFVPETAAEVEGIELRVDGLTCPFCSLGLEKKLKRVDGVEGVQVHMKRGITEVASNPEKAPSLTAIRKAVKDAGFALREIRLTVTGSVVREDEAWVLQSSGDETRYFLFDAEHAQGNVGDSAALVTITAERAQQLEGAARTGTLVTAEGRVHEHKGMPSGLLVERLELHRP